MNATRTAAATLIAAGLTITGAAAAHATKGADHKPWICHPVEGNGETGTGWNLINPDKASVHIDEATGAGKHTRKDGRTDVYATDGVCPGGPVVTVTPTPTPSETTPEPTPTQTTTPKPSPTVTTTAEPTPTVTTTPKPTPSATATTTPSPTPTVETPKPSPSATASVAPKPSPSHTPTAHSTTAPATEKATPATAHRAELAHTGTDPRAILLGLALTLLGLAAKFWGRRDGAHQ